MIIILTFLAAAGSVGFSIMTLRLPPEKNPLPNVYTADAVLMVEEESNNMADLMSTMGYTSSQSGTDPLTLALEIMQSRGFLDQVVEDLGLREQILAETPDAVITQNDLRKMLKRSVSFWSPQQSSKIVINSTSTDPEEAMNLVNQYVHTLQAWFFQSGGETSANQMKTMEVTMTTMDKKIQALEAEIEKFQTKYNVLTVEELALAQNTMINNMRAELVALDQEISDYESFSRVEDSALKRMKARKEGLVSLIQKIENGYDGNRYSLPSKNDLPTLAREFKRKTSDLEVQMKLYQTVAERYEVTKLTSTKESPFYVLQYAELPDEKSGPSRGSLCMKITGGAFVLGIALAILLDLLKKVFMDPRNVKIIKGLKK